jgi:tetratricopeptide (TPR) repeat protein
MRFRARFALITLLSFISPAAAQENPWTGELVQYIKPAKDIQFGDRVGDKQVTFPFSGIMPIKVRDEREGWLRIHDGRREGWVDKADFVLMRDAPAYFQRRLVANPTDTWALSMRGRGWLDAGEPDNAIKDFSECIRLNPADAAAFNSRGIAWNTKREYDRALTDFNDAIRLDPRSPLAYYNRGFTWGVKKDYAKAIADFNEAIRLDPNYRTAYHARGIAWSVKNDFGRAIADYTEAIRLDPNYEIVFYNRGSAWYRKKEYDKALADYTEAIRLNPKYKLAYNNRAWLRATCPDADYRDGKKALESAISGLALDPNDGSSMDTLAAAHAECGDFTEAVRWQEKALADPQLKNDAAARRRLDLYRDMKPYREE